MAGQTGSLKRFFSAGTPFSAAAAIDLQREWAPRIIRHDQLDDTPVTWVAGVDVGFEQNNTITRAAVALLRLPELTLEEYAVARTPTTVPYIPGLLSFREIPALLNALEQLQRQPQLILCDGQGIAHPRRFGIAAHLGLLLDIPTVGVAKTRLTGRHAEPPDQKGAWVELRDKDEVIGAVLRTRPGVKPLYISVGHRISLATAIDYVMICTTRYRLPETTRWAHRIASGKPDEITRALEKNARARREQGL